MVLIKVSIWLGVVLAFLASSVSMYYGLRNFYDDVKAWVLILCVYNTISMFLTCVMLYSLGGFARGVGGLSLLFCYLFSSSFVFSIVSSYFRIRYLKEVCMKNNNAYIK